MWLWRSPRRGPDHHSHREAKQGADAGTRGFALFLCLPPAAALDPPSPLYEEIQAPPDTRELQVRPGRPLGVLSSEMSGL